MLENAVSLWRRLMGWEQSASTSEEAPADDRRVWVRHAADLPTEVVASNEEHPAALRARIRDVSRGGIRLAAEKGFEPGELLTVSLPGAEGRGSLAVLACVVRCEQTAGTEWSIGCSFAQELTDDDLRAFGAERVPCPVPGARTWARFSCAVEATYQVVSYDDDTPHQATVVNISARGIGLLVDSPVEAGTVLSAHLHRNGGPTVTILACVVHTTEQPEGKHLLGCSFIRELTEKDLGALV